MADSLPPSPGTRQSGLAARPVVIDPAPDEAQAIAAYRAGAIARDHEQRKAEGREKHPEIARMRAEAMMHAYALVGAGLWNDEDVARLAARLEG
jgi:hypothetical protein